MRYSAEQLPPKLDRLGAAILISGDETLLVEETLDRLRAQLKAEGFSERECHYIEREKDTNFASLLQASSNFSLFSSRRIIEWRFRQAPGPAAQTALQEFVDHASPDVVLIAVAPALTKKTLDSDSLKALSQRGTLITADSISAERFGSWLSQRARTAGLSLSPEALRHLHESCEGNLLAAQQTLSHLVLLYPDSTVSLEQLAEVAASQARYEVYEVMDTALAGDAARAIRMLQGLRADDAVGNLRQLLPAVQRDCRSLAQLGAALAEGDSMEQALGVAKIWFKRQKPFSQGVKRVGLRGARLLVRQAFEVERMMKGAVAGDPWLTLERILLKCAGVKG